MRASAVPRWTGTPGALAPANPAPGGCRPGTPTDASLHRHRVSRGAQVMPTVAATPAAPRRYGKRPVADARKEFVAVRCNAVEYARMNAAAAQAGLSVGAYLRTLALGTAGPRAVRRPPVEKEALARLLGELGKLGSNVNQLAREVNTTGNLPAWSELAAARGAIDDMRAALMKALGREA